MKLYFKVNGDKFDTNLPTEMQYWLSECIELTDEVLELLDKTLSVINSDEEYIVKFIASGLGKYTHGEKYVYSPFDAAINALENRLFSFEGITDYDIGNFYAENFSQYMDEYIEMMQDEYEDFDEDEVDLEEFGPWKLAGEVRNLYEDVNNDLTYDMSDCKCCAPLDDLRKVLENIDTYDEDDADENENNENDTYKQLILAGAGIVKDLKAIQAMDDDNCDEVFESGVHLYDALKRLVSVAVAISTNDDSPKDLAAIFYADMVSVYAYDKIIGEKYYDLFWKMNAGDKKADAELLALSKTIPDDAHYWVRRNV